MLVGVGVEAKLCELWVEMMDVLRISAYVSGVKTRERADEQNRTDERAFVTYEDDEEDAASNPATDEATAIELEVELDAASNPATDEATAMEVNEDVGVACVEVGAGAGVPNTGSEEEDEEGKVVTEEDDEGKGEAEDDVEDEEEDDDDEDEEDDDEDDDDDDDVEEDTLRPAGVEATGIEVDVDAEVELDDKSVLVPSVDVEVDVEEVDVDVDEEEELELGPLAPASTAVDSGPLKMIVLVNDPPSVNVVIDTEVERLALVLVELHTKTQP